MSLNDSCNCEVVPSFAEVGVPFFGRMPTGVLFSRFRFVPELLSCVVASGIEVIAVPFVADVGSAAVAVAI